MRFNCLMHVTVDVGYRAMSPRIPPRLSGLCGAGTTTESGDGGQILVLARGKPLAAS